MRWIYLNFFIFNAILSQFCGASITPLPHQQKVLNYLKNKPKTKGLLLFHELGAGKTITALAYAKSERYRKKIILAPKVLKSHWKTEMEKMGITDHENYTILTFNEKKDLQKIKKINLKESIVIIDEIQKYIEKIRFTMDEDLLGIYWSLAKAHRILALSGTPLYNDAADISFIGNLLMGKKAFPFNPEIFKQKFTDIKTSTSLFRGYLTESKLAYVSTPILFTLFGLSIASVSGSVWAVPLMTMLGSSILLTTNEKFPAERVVFSKFNNFQNGFLYQQPCFFL